MCVWLYVCMHATCVPDACKGQHMVLDTLELEYRLWVATWELRTKTRSAARASSAHNYSALSPASLHGFCVLCTYRSHRGSRMVSDPLKLQVVVNYPKWVMVKSINNCWIISQDTTWEIFIVTWVYRCVK